MKKSILTITTMLICLTSCEAAGPKPPIELAFAVHQAGTKVTTELRIVEKGPHQYPFDLKFAFRNNDAADRERVIKLVGTYTKDKHGNLIKPGIQIPLKLTIISIGSEGEKLFLEKEVFVGGCYAYGINYFRREIDYIRLPSGLYRVTVESIKDISELADTSVFFTIRNPLGK